MLKIELPQPETTLPDEDTADEATPGRPDAVSDRQRPRSEQGPAIAAIAGSPYRRTFACTSTSEEPHEPAKV